MKVMAAAAALVAGMVVAPQGQVMLHGRFIGNMAWSISDGLFTLMSDFPYDSGAVSGYMTYDAAAEVKSPTAQTLALITHRHGDHWSPTLFAKTNWRIVAPRDVTATLPRDRVVPVSPRFPYGPLRIDAIETPHANIGHYSYVVAWHGKRLYFSGDTASPAHLIALKNLDVAFVSPWLYRAVLKNASRVDAKRVVIYHHEPNEGVPECRSGCYLPRQGESLRF
jgi:L-ascorbate metabolism protein UlaG (beta-lactamase superfamily)